MKAIVRTITGALYRLKSFITGKPILSGDDEPHRGPNMKFSKSERKLAKMAPEQRAKIEERKARRLQREDELSAMTLEERAKRERKRAERKAR